MHVLNFGSKRAVLYGHWREKFRNKGVNSFFSNEIDKKES